jgi:hypothetical protein
VITALEQQLGLTLASTTGLCRTYLSHTAWLSWYGARAGAIASGISCRSVRPSLMKIRLEPSYGPFV